MSLLCDKEILVLCEKHEMITPFVKDNVRFAENGNKVISYGISTIGYDVTLSAEKAVIFIPSVKDLTNVSQINTKVDSFEGNFTSLEIDPLNFKEETLKELELKVCERTGHKYFLIPPHSFMLGYTNEYFKMPQDVGAVCFGKSTYARCGIDIHVTPIEPGFEGNVVLEFSNETPLPIRVYADQGVCQFTFHKTTMRPATTYSDKQGKYQGQRGITLPKG